MNCLLLGIQFHSNVHHGLKVVSVIREKGDDGKGGLNRESGQREWWKELGEG